MGCCGQDGETFEKVSPSSPEYLPADTESTTYRYYIGDDWLSDFSGTALGRYQPVGDGRVFHIFKLDAALADTMPDLLNGAAYLEYKNPSPPPSPVSATASAIRLAKETDIDLASIVGTGKGGKVTKADVQEKLQ